MRKGNYGEMTTDELFRQQGYERISLAITTELDQVTHRGIDGIYYNPNWHPPYIIAEAKYGGSRLSYLKDGIKQMESKWIGDRLVDALGEEQVRVITKEIKQGNVGAQLVRIKTSGHISIDNLDSYGNIVRP